MNNSNFDRNGVDKYGTHWLQYAAFVVTAFAIYFAWAFFNDTSFHHFAFKYSIFCYEHNLLDYCVMGWNVEFDTRK